MNEYLEKQKICREEKLAAINNSENIDSTSSQGDGRNAEQSVETVVRAGSNNFSAPNTGFESVGGVGGVFFIALAILILLTVIIAKSGKKIRGVFMVVVMFFTVFAPVAMTRRASASECAERCLSAGKYSVVVDFANAEPYNLVGRTFEGAGDYNKDKEMVEEWLMAEYGNLEGHAAARRTYLNGDSMSLWYLRENNSYNSGVNYTVDCNTVTFSYEPILVHEVEIEDEE